MGQERWEILFIEVGITSQDRLQQVETEKLRKYDLLASEADLTYKAQVKIIPYAMAWDGIAMRHRGNT